MKTKPFKPVVTGTVLANMLIMTLAVLFLQRGGAFADIAQCSDYFSSVWKNNRVLSSERYGHYPVPFKSEFWSQREVLYFPHEELKAGDIVLLHNTSGDVSAQLEVLKENFELETLGRFLSSSTPLLPDIMVTPPMMTSNPPAMGFRFTRQDYVTVAVLLKDKP